MRFATEAKSAANSARLPQVYFDAARLLNEAGNLTTKALSTSFSDPQAQSLSQQGVLAYYFAVSFWTEKDYNDTAREAGSAIALIQEAFSTEHNYQTQQALLKEQKQYEIAIEALAALAVIALVVVVARRRK